MSAVLNVSHPYPCSPDMALTHNLSIQNDAYKNTFGNPGSNAQGAIVAAMPAGSLVGALIVSYLADKIGRRKSIIISGWVWVVGSILQCAAVVCPLSVVN